MGYVTTKPLKGTNKIVTKILKTKIANISDIFRFCYVKEENLMSTFFQETYFILNVKFIRSTKFLISKVESMTNDQFLFFLG